MAYRLLLGREPESAGAVAGHVATCPDLAALRARFLNSEEYTSRTVVKLSPQFDLGKPVRVDVNVTRDLLDKMLCRVEETWRYLGAVEPYWSVITAEKYKQANFSENASDFYESGQGEVNRLFAWLMRNDVNINTESASCCEYGCGTGRVTRWLAARFSKVIACDISQPHIDRARENLNRLGTSNVTFHQIGSLDALSTLSPVDVVFSFIVLQHNPPPVMALILSNLLRILKPGGVAFFQVPVYSLSYAFTAEDYVEQPLTHKMEMHVLPQKHIHAIAREQKCDLLEVGPDGFAGMPGWLSMTFLMRKRGSS